MKYVIQIAGQKVVLDDERMTQLTELLLGATMLNNSYVGTGKGDDGTNYSLQILPYDSENHLSLTAMSDSRYEALILKTKLQKEQQ